MCVIDNFLAYRITNWNVMKLNNIYGVICTITSELKFETLKVNFTFNYENKQTILN